MSSNNEIEKAAQKQKSKDIFTKENLEKRYKELQGEEQKAVNLMQNTERELFQIRGAILLIQEQLQSFK